MIGLYVHIPFCIKKCPYCDFVSFDTEKQMMTAYVDALCREIQYQSPLTSQLSTIYIGGGTPSLLETEHLKSLFKCIYKYFDCTSLEEVTFEANPDSLTNEKLILLRNIYANMRLSMGMQSFVEKDLKSLERIHVLDDSINKYYLARKIGYQNINIDLMYGIPGQGKYDWEYSLQKAVDLRPEHISVYCLTVHEGTKFSADKISFDEDLAYQMYEYAIGYLLSNGYNHYEISNFSLPGFESKHNTIYWKNNEYTGVGCSAVSYLKGIRRKNTADINKYLQTAGENTAHDEIEELDEKKRLSETMILGLRMREGIELTEHMYNNYRHTIDKFTEMGFLDKGKGRIAISRKGLFVSNQILSEFV